MEKASTKFVEAKTVGEIKTKEKMFSCPNIKDEAKITFNQEDIWNHFEKVGFKIHEVECEYDSVCKSCSRDFKVKMIRNNIGE